LLVWGYIYALFIQQEAQHLQLSPQEQAVFACFGPVQLHAEQHLQSPHWALELTFFFSQLFPSPEGLLSHAALPDFKSPVLLQHSFDASFFSAHDFSAEQQPDVAFI